tara:strand:- start:823 stop:1113 length:291 start_codon:yes stop_codon:yes gene_type:complete
MRTEKGKARSGIVIKWILCQLRRGSELGTAMLKERFTLVKEEGMLEWCRKCPKWHKKYNHIKYATWIGMGGVGDMGGLMKYMGRNRLSLLSGIKCT